MGIQKALLGSVTLTVAVCVIHAQQQGKPSLEEVAMLLARNEDSYQPQSSFQQQPFQGKKQQGPQSETGVFGSFSSSEEKTTEKPNVQASEPKERMALEEPTPGDALEKEGKKGKDKKLKRSAAGKSAAEEEVEEEEEEEEEEGEVETGIEEKPKKGRKSKKGGGKKGSDGEGGQVDEEEEKLVSDVEMDDLGRKNCRDDDEIQACSEACSDSPECTKQDSDMKCDQDCYKMCRFAEKWIERKCTNHMMAHIKYYRDKKSGKKSIKEEKKKKKDGKDEKDKSGKSGMSKRDKGPQTSSKQQAPSKDAQSGSGGGEGLSGLLDGGGLGGKGGAPSLLG